VEIYNKGGRSQLVGKKVKEKKNKKDIEEDLGRG